MTTDPIAVVLSCDDKFVRHAACTIASIVKNSDRRYQFYLLDCGISERNKQKLAAWDLGGNTLTVMPMGKVEAFEQVPLKPWFSPAIFYRLLIPELFPELTKAIYLDSDIVVVGDLGDLWDIDLGNQLMGVVYVDPDFVSCTLYAERKQRLGLDRQQRYFNNGVLLMNLPALRTWGFLTKTIQFLSTASVVLDYPEQDAMNAVLPVNEVLGLAPRFNFMVPTPYAKRVAKQWGVTCVHYIRSKPWWFCKRFVRCCPNFYFQWVHQYYYYAQYTPWAAETQAEVSCGRFVKEVLKVLGRPIKYSLHR